jgi:SAM-dependent methyltransferase
MKRLLLNHLVCPCDSSALALEILEEDRNGEILRGTLRSAEGRTYPIERGVPRFVESDQYATTFSRQRQLVRKHWNSYRLDDNEERKLFVASTGFDLRGLDGLTLDAGCGFGRFARFVSAAGSEVIGVDLSSDTVDIAFDNIGRQELVHIVQADLTRLPFRRGLFKRVFSIGVLHHTPDTRKSFEQLLPYLCPGGEAAIWVYPPEMKVTSDVWRKLTLRLPLRVVYGWCVLNEALFAPLRSLPGAWRLGRIVPGGALGRPFWVRVLSDFDDLTPRFAHSHSPQEVRNWFADAGLADIEILPRLSAVRGRKPRAAQY